MPTRKTASFLPSVFQTDSNKKFLNATLDQLITEPNLKTINGYVGRRFAPGFNGTATYINERTPYRADYQLEPSVVHKDPTTDNVDFFANYPELLQKLNFYGANVSNQNDYFASDYYSYNPRINADLFVNYGQYYWVPNGPDAVPVNPGAAQLERTYYVFPNANLDVYYMSGYGKTANPDIVLARGGNYQFIIDQKDKKFYIQTQPGLSGRSDLTNLSTREVLGVTNNGTDKGTVYFNVPLTTDQDSFINMPVVQNIDLATNVTYTQLQGKLLSQIKNDFGGIDGQITNLNGKFVIFINGSSNDSDWTDGITIVPTNQRNGVWSIQLTPVGNDFVVNFVFYQTIPINNKVIVLSGINYGNTEWYTTIANVLAKIPVITAPLNILYYQDSENESQYGIIRLVDVNNNVINVDEEILGKKNYVSPNGITFTNGLKIEFNNDVTPDSYKNKQYYVEGVGSSIRLILVNDLIATFQTSSSSYDPESTFVLYANAVLNTSKDQLTISTVDFPDGSNVKIGDFPNSINTNYISEQNTVLYYPYKGGNNDQGNHDSIRFSEEIIGVTLPGIPIKGVSDGSFIPGENGTVWHYDTNFVNLTGRDIYGGSVGDNGEYFYTKNDFITANAWGNVSGFTSGSYTHPDGHSKIIGFAADGYPIYGPYGYINPSPSDETTDVKQMISGYYANISLSKYRPSSKEVSVTTDTTNGDVITISSTSGINPGMRITKVNGALLPEENRPLVLNNALKTAVGLQNYLGDFTVLLNQAVSYPTGTKLTFDFAPGSFIEDMVHQSIYPGGKPLYDLDIYNGRFCKTPEFPQGTYAYFTTFDYPWILGPSLYGSKSIPVNESLYTPDYIVINRASQDLNPWSRRNRWFHKSVLDLTERYLNKSQLIVEDYRAKRPIIEFDPNLQLFNFGKISKNPIDIFDTTFTSPLSQVQGQLQGMYIDGVLLTNNMRIVFSNDSDPRTKGTIWAITFENLDDSGLLKLKLTPAVDGTVLEYESITVLNGRTTSTGYTNRGKSFWWDGANWNYAQQKLSINQLPLFDVFDEADISFGDTTKYPSINAETSFTGTKIFAYKVGTGTNDPYLGFPLSYKNFENVGDIEFENSFESETFEYRVDNTNYTKNVNSGFLHQNNRDGTFRKINVWTNTNSQSRQMQDLAFIYNGIDNNFTLDIKPDLAKTKLNFIVYVNYRRLNNQDYQLFEIPGNQLYMTIKPNKMNAGDRIDVLVYNSLTVSKIGFYQVPDNLNLNSQNSKILNPTLGEMRNHIGTLGQNSILFAGSYPGVSNLRDIYIENQGGSIVQQSAPVPYSMMFLCNEQYNFVNSLQIAKQEYTKFKNRFLQIASSDNTINPDSPVTAVDTILQQINAIKDKTFPWYYSGMVPYGDNKTVITYNVFNPLQRNYEITTNFNNDVVSNKAVLVYLNGEQLIYKKDYEFLPVGAGIAINSNITLVIDDTITIAEYDDTDGCWIPETPTKLGLYPKFVPNIFTDRTYTQPVQFLQGHDGSLTKTFGDFRDQILLELEKRIYNNIKVRYSEKSVNIFESIPGRFRDTGLTYFYYIKLLSKFFLSWAASNNLDYVTNSSYVNDSPFSYNYGNNASFDVIDGAALQGSWRAVYQYWYDCQTPHLTPWQMLGFSEEPDWWQSQYGPAPYTSGNAILWTDLENGYIAQGSRQGYDTRFARPGLSSFIPVNENGVLLPPLGTVTQKFDVNGFNNPWIAGQFGPVETAWRNSSEYPFAIQYVMAMTKPAKYFAYGINTDSYRYNVDLDQYLVEGTNTRLQPTDIKINGYTYHGQLQRTTGYLNWISDNLTYNGTLSKELFADYIYTFNVQLAYKFAGFTDKKQLKVLAEQNSPGSLNESVLIPDADLEIFLHKSVPILNPRYSAMIIEKTGGGFKISGYDKNNPYFTIVVPTTSGSKSVVRVLNRSVDYYQEFSNYTLDIPYGTEIASLQQLAVIMCGYEKFLNLSGFKFDFLDSTLGQIRDWTLSLKEVLFWSQQQWNTNSVITVSPIANMAKFVNLNGIIDEISNNFYGTKILNQNFQIVDSKQLNVTRDNNFLYIDLASNTDLIGFIDLNLVQYEHVMICNNKTQFNDIIYDPISGQRQFRLKLVGTKTAEWTGYLNPPGYIYNTETVQPWIANRDYLKGDLVDYKSFYYYASMDLPATDSFSFADWIPVNKNNIKTGLLPNFARDAQLGQTYYNIEKINLESPFDQYSLGLIGFRNRNYLNDLGVDDTSQVKFYQGFIKQKGTLNALNALGNVSFGNQETAVQINEEWAFRSGTYGSVDTNQYVEIVLNESYTTANPTSLEINSNGSVTYSSIFNYNNGLYKTAEIPFQTPFLLNRTVNSNYSDDIQTAGWVNLDDVNFTVFDINDINKLDPKSISIGDQSVIWVAKDANYDWNVYRIDVPSCTVIGLTNALNTNIKVTTDRNHGLLKNDVVLIKNVSKFEGFYKVIAVDSLTSFVININESLRGFSNTTENGYLCKLVSLRVDRPSDINNITPYKGWSANNKVWVNEYNSDNEWAVYIKSDPWSYDSRLGTTTLSNNYAFGTSIQLSYDSKFAAVGLPGYDSNVGAITNYVIGYNNNFIEKFTYSASADDTIGIGSSVDMGTEFVITGAPNSNSNKGYVFVYKRETSGELTLVQVLNQPGIDPELFGTSLAMSNDDQWLYVGAPGAAKVYVYALNSSLADQEETIVGDGSTTAFTLTFQPASIENILVYSALKTFVPYKDFNLSGSTLTFVTPPAAGSIAVKQQKSYTFYLNLSGNTGSQFGFSLSCTSNGAQVVVGEPSANITIGANTIINAGSFSVYDRSLQNIIVTVNPNTSTGGSVYNISPPADNFSSVYLNGEQLVLGQDYYFSSSNTVLNLVTYNPEDGYVPNPPPASSIITYASNKFKKIQTVIASEPDVKAKFGYSVSIASDASSVYAGSPYRSRYNYYTGAVYRYINEGSIYGTITGTVQNPTVVAGQSFRINNYVVIFSGTDLNAIINSIANSGIPGIIAENDNGYLKISSTSISEVNKLQILPDVGTTVLADLGLSMYVETQILNNPFNKSYDYFGKNVKFNRSNNALIVGSDLAATLIKTQFDPPQLVTTAKTSYLVGNYTTFDGDTTQFKEPVEESGAVWVYGLLSDNRNSIQYPDTLTYIQQIIPRTSTSLDIAMSSKLGASIAISNNVLLLGAPANTINGYNSGRVWKFLNPDNLSGWDILRSQEPKVDIDCLIKGFTYSAKDQIIKDTYDFIDPAKGKILGVAEQEITYKIDFDPAVYNNINGNPVSGENKLFWSNQQVGQVWWDLSRVRFIDYEQDSIKYRATNWGKIFPGSSVDIYEWVESNYPPKKYVANGGSGTPKFSNNEAYVTQSYIDPSSNYTTVKYYFWVKNKTTVTINQFGRSVPIASIANYITNPLSSGIKYYAALRDDTIAVFNTNKDPSGNDLIFHLDYKTLLNSGIIHNEYSLLSESGTQTRDIPDSLINKMVDSLSGLDKFGYPVPDPALPIQTKLGISIRPRQSMVIDRNEALRNVIFYVNKLFQQFLIAQSYDISGLEGGEDYPVANSGAYDLVVNNLEELSIVDIATKPMGYKVLVLSDSSVDNLWVIYTKDQTAYDWQANTSYVRGQYINYNSRSYYVITDFTSTDEFKTVSGGSTVLTAYRPQNVWNIDRVQSYYVPNYWEYVDWYADGYDKTTKPNYIVDTSADLPNIAFNSGDVVKINNNGSGKWFIIQVFPTGVNTVAIQDGTIQFKDSLYNLADNGMGFGSDNFDSNRFDQNPFLETRQIFASLKDQILINELDTEFAKLFFILVYYVFDEQKAVDWAFKTSYIVAKQQIQAFTQPQIFNNNVQDYYRQYIEEVKPYHTTIREFIPNYIGSDNFNGYTTDFDVPPIYDSVLKTNRSPSGEFIEDAKYLRLPQYRDWLFSYGYYIDSIEIIDGGSGYTLAPVVTITGSSNNNDAVAKAFITNGIVSRIDLLYQGSNYINNPVITITGGNGTGATARANLRNDFIRKIQTTIKYDRITYGTTVLDWEPNTAYNQGQIIAYNDKAYIVNSLNFSTSDVFSLVGLTEYSVDKFLNANDRIQAYYQPETGSTIKNFAELEIGIGYPGVEIDSLSFSEGGGFDQTGFDTTPFDPFQVNEDGINVVSEELLDTVITSNYLDSSLGIRPEDIIVAGGPYVYDYFTEWAANTAYSKGDLISYENLVYYSVNAHTTSSTFSTNNLTIYNVGPYASHAPEELLPGRVFDTLEMTVYTLAADPESVSYINWQSSEGIGVGFIQILEPGFGFDANSVYVVVEGGGATLPAEAQVVLDSNGSATSFVVTYTGAGYITTPNVIVYGSNIEPIVASCGMTVLHAPSSGSPYQKMTYKIYKDMNDLVTYLRVDGSRLTTLSQNLSITDTTIHVANARLLPTPSIAGSTPNAVWINGKTIVYNYTMTGNLTTYTSNTTLQGSNTIFLTELSEGQSIYDLSGNLIGTIANITSNTSANLTTPPNVGQNTLGYSTISTKTLPMPGPAEYALGVVWINGERIVYNYKNDTTNTLGQLRRGTGGTGSTFHYAGNVVYDGSQNQVILNSSNYTWTPNSNTVLKTVDYDGLISAFTTNTTLNGVGTLFTSQFYPGTMIYDTFGNLIGTISNVTSDTSANLTANAIFAVSNQEFATFGQFYAGNTYIRSNVWNTGSTESIGTEANVILATEANVGFEIDSSVFILANAKPLFNSNSIQVQFLKQGLLD